MEQAWFNFDRLNVLIGVITYTGLLIWFIYSAKRGKPLFIRRIAGLEAVDEAIGRATEMGKPPSRVTAEQFACPARELAPFCVLRTGRQDCGAP
jgi:hypothetical protein